MIGNSSPDKMPDLLRKISATRKKRLEEQISSQMTLPLWTEEQRGVPNGPLRSCLFAALGRGTRKHVERVPICSQGNTEIIYTGVRLDQDYLTLWETLIHMARSHELGTRCEVTIYQLLKELGKTDSGSNREILLRQLSNLSATDVEIAQGQYAYSGSLVDEAYRDKDSGLIVIMLNPKLVALFQPDQFTKISWAIRKGLKKPLAKWLHGFYSSHLRPFDVSVEYIRKLSGSEAQVLRDFRNHSLIPAFKELEAACEAKGEFFKWEILPNDLVRVHRTTALGKNPAFPDVPVLPS